MAAREEFETEYILSVRERVEGSRTTASKILGLSRKALWEKCKRYGIPSAKDEPEEEDQKLSCIGTKNHKRRQARSAGRLFFYK
jgi:hypothetical protein